MQKEIKAIIDDIEEKPKRAWRVKIPNEPVRESTKWHMRHRPYQGGNKCETHTHSARK